MADWDLEVHGIEEPALASLLEESGHVSAVGRSFGVYKLRRGRLEVDVSLPRRDSNAGPGHRGIRVQGDPHMGVAEAARRRDLTVNAILLDPLTGELLDPYGGLEDLRQGLLRPVDHHTFLEDPLRALRAVQFAARLGMLPTEDLVDLCAAAPLSELPPERIEGEWRKLLVKGQRPSLGLDLARRAQVLSRVFPEVADDPTIDQALDLLTAAPPEPWPRHYAAALCVWLHLAPEAALPTLDRLGLHTLARYPLRERVLTTLAHQHAPRHSDAHLRHLSTRAEVELTLVVLRSLGDARAQAQLERARALGVSRQAPPALVQGRDLLDMGLVPGPRVGQVLSQLYQEQLEGELSDREHALTRAREVLSAPAVE